MLVASQEFSAAQTPACSQGKGDTRSPGSGVTLQCTEGECSLSPSCIYSLKRGKHYVMSENTERQTYDGAIHWRK